MARKLRVSFIEFLNAVPLGWDFLYGNRRGVFELLDDVPSQCAARLASGEADIGLIPVIEYQRIPGLRVIPDISIACKREVRSVLFVSRIPIQQVRKIALDTSSRTSVALLQILLNERFHNPQVRFVPLPPHPERMLRQCEAALIIGNPALTVPLEGLHIYDLAWEWNQLTGLPFVFAFWAVRKGVEVGESVQYFRQSRDGGLRNVEQIARLYSEKLHLPAAQIQSYLLENLNYSLDPENLRGLRHFFQRAAYHGLIADPQPLRFVEVETSSLQPQPSSLTVRRSEASPRLNLKAAVKTGLELLLEEELERIRGRRLGVIAHPASVDSRLIHIIDRLHQHPEVALTTILGPQHGAWGETQDNMIEWESYRDPRTRLPVYSLYGETRSPSEKMLSEVEVLIFDLQDVGSRYYTFIYTMALAMQSCARYDVEFLVLDRPNPISGASLEGNVLERGFESFVGMVPLAARHAMTVGEMAGYFNDQFELKCRLSVIAMQGWSRELFFDETGLPWVMPSPNMPTPDAALVYPGLCLLEGTNVSEGRGTTRPFEISGAPWIDPYELKERLEDLDLPGAVFRPIHFIPTFHKWSGECIGGVQIHVTDRRLFRPFRTGLALVQLYRELGGDRFQWKQPPYEYEYEKLPFDILCGTARIRNMIEDGLSPAEMEASWQADLKEFEEIRKKYLLY